MQPNGTISLGNINLPANIILAALFNAAKTQGMGRLHHRPSHTMTPEEAQELLDAGENYFDYVEGRILKADFRGHEIDPGLYDRDNGPGAAYKAVQEASIVTCLKE